MPRILAALAAPVLLVLVPVSLCIPAAPPDPWRLTRVRASAFARIALAGIQKEYPNKPGHVLDDARDVLSPRTLHPAFYGCFDWHSSVHGHWMLVRLIRLHPDLPEARRIRTVLAEHFTARNLQTEADYFARPSARSSGPTVGPGC